MSHVPSTWLASESGYERHRSGPFGANFDHLRKEWPTITGANDDV
jgi:hypothetical protein